jgi:DNA-binding MarR family transcriptional regulator
MTLCNISIRLQAEPPSPVNPIEDVLTALRRIIRATDLHSKHLEKTAGLTAPQLLLLQILQSHTGTRMTSGALAREMSLSQATVTTILDRLEARQLVRRERSGTDKRKVYVTLTETGSRTLELAPAPLQQYFATQFQALETWEQTMILAALQRIAHMMNAQNLDASPVLDVGALDRDTSSSTRKIKRTNRTDK